MTQQRNGQITAKTGAVELGITERKFRQLFSSYLKACNEQHEQTWQTGQSGATGRPPFPKRLRSYGKDSSVRKNPPAASEAFRRFGFSAALSSWGRLL
jgi:hypothetical protein